MHDEVNIDSHIHIYLELLRVGVPYHSGKKIAENLILIKNYFAFIYGKLRPKQKRGDDLLNYIPNFRGEGSTSFISKTQFQIIIFWSYCEPHWVQVNLCLKTPRLKFILLLDFTTFFIINDVLRKQYID